MDLSPQSVEAGWQGWLFRRHEGSGCDRGRSHRVGEGNPQSHCGKNDAILQSTAQLTLHSSFELTAAQAYRKQRLADGKSKVSLNDLIAHAIIETLKAHPEMNAHFLGDRIAVFEKVHLGVAVDTPRGLLVPVVRDSSDLSIENLSSAIKKLAGDCREGTISPDDLAGGSFTLTNLGDARSRDFHACAQRP